MTAKHAKSRKRRRLTRRGFLTGLGIGTTAVVLQRPVDALDRITVRSGGLQPSPDSFGRIFSLPPFADLNSPTLRGALTDMGARASVIDADDPLEVGPVRLITEPDLSPNNLDNPNHTAGTTFVGQFLDHDMTFDLSPRLGEPLEPERRRTSGRRGSTWIRSTAPDRAAARNSTTRMTLTSSAWRATACSRTCLASRTASPSSPTSETTRT